MLEVTAAVSESRTCCMDCRRLELVVLLSWNLCVCRYSIYWICVGSGITINTLFSSSVLMYWPREIPICWTSFTHVFHMSLDEFFSPYVNMALPKDLDSPDFAFSLMVVTCWPLPIWMILHIPLPPPLPERPNLSLYTVVYWCWLDRPCYIINICNSTVSDLRSVYGNKSGAPYLLFGAAPVLCCLYLLFDVRF